MAAGLFAFFIALFASLFLTVPVRALALRVGMVDLPGPRKVHLQPIPLLGGLAMYAGVVLGVLFLFNGPAREQIEGILAGATLIAAVGILDDRGLLHHQIKLFVGMPLAAGILLLSGIRAQVFNTLFGGRTGDLLDIVLTVVWVVGITASFSILDHMDGLCAGVAAMASAFFALLAYLNGQTLVTVLAAAVLGAASGFLRWNFKPAKIFMGDGGAMFLGFLMATLGLKLRLAESNMLSAWVVPVLVLGATIFDTTLVTISLGSDAGYEVGKLCAAPDLDDGGERLRLFEELSVERSPERSLDQCFHADARGGNEKRGGSRKNRGQSTAQARRNPHRGVSPKT